MDDVDCIGSESSLTDCVHAGWGTNNCNHDEDISIECALTTTAPPNGKYTRSVRYRLLWPPYGIGQPTIFCPVVSFDLSFSPRLISAVADWMSTILLHMVWP